MKNETSTPHQKSTPTTRQCKVTNDTYTFNESQDDEAELHDSAAATYGDYAAYHDYAASAFRLPTQTAPASRVISVPQIIQLSLVILAAAIALYQYRAMFFFSAAIIVNSLYFYLLLYGLYLWNTGIKLFPSYLSAHHISNAARHRASQIAAWEELLATQGHLLPYYSIMVPLYREKNVLPHLIQAINNLKYPQDRLQVLLVLESDDLDTIRAAREASLPAYCQVIVVPETTIKTKANACNYALRFARGTYLGVYDADDYPDEYQLLRSVQEFQSGPSDLVCLQMRLNYYNFRENWLTQMFAIEYSGLFDYLLPALAYLQLPIPLGGSSNHFVLDILHKIGGWDPYNVTEDADIGIRLTLNGYRIQMVDNYTLEEAPVTVKAWLRQRARWIKGHMQTFLVHTRDFSTLRTVLKPRGIAAMSYMLALPYFAMLLGPWLLTLSVLSLTSFLEISPAMSHILLIFGLINLTFSAIFNLVKAFVIDRKWGVSWYLFPVYQLLQVWSAYIALYQLITAPSYWHKTEHGISSYHRSSSAHD